MEVKFNLTNAFEIAQQANQNNLSERTEFNRKIVDILKNQIKPLSLEDVCAIAKRTA